MDLDLKALFARLDQPCTAALEAAAGTAVTRGQHEVTVEHLLAALLPHITVPQSAILLVAVERVRDARHVGSSGRPVFSPLLIEWLQQGWLLGSVERGARLLHPGALLTALVRNRRRLADESYERLLPDGVDDPAEAMPSVTASAAPVDADPLRRFCIDFSAKAAAGSIDPVFGRDREIRALIDILARRRKNNPICVGEPGVGKTAVVEGLALRIAAGDVPDLLKDVRLLGLDLALLQAGAGVQGEFAARLTAVIRAVQASPSPIILFIDEAHTLIGAGGSAGGSDAANLLKPALARGELRTIAATTWAEYKKYFEKDPALARRFQPVVIDEPSVAATITVLRGLRERYEQGHGVIIRDAALVAAAELGARYITGRQHPDKGIDLIDTAAARVVVARSTKPVAIQDAEQRIAELTRTLGALDRDAAAATAIDQDARDAAVVELAAVRQRLATSTTDDPPSEVTPQVIASVISDWTGVPVGDLVRDRATALLTLDQCLRERIRGQDQALTAIAEGLRTAATGITDPRQPLGVFLLVGPSGVGKTETATAVADLLFGGPRFLTSINLSEYQEKHSVSRLVGSPPGYIGYGEGGVLTEAVRQRPYCTVLLDEVEKADLEVLNLFYQVFDKGTLNDGEGRTVDFANTAIFLTSNLATARITTAALENPGIDAQELTALIRPELSRHFKPALLARMRIIPFLPVTGAALEDIVRLKVMRLKTRVEQTHKLRLTIDDQVITAIAARCTEVDSGARNVDHVLNGSLAPLIARDLLGRMADGGQLPDLRLGVGTDGGFTLACALRMAGASA